MSHLLKWGRLKQLSCLDLHPFLRRRFDAGYAPRTVALDITVCKMMFKWARLDGIVHKYAGMRVPKLKVDRNRFVINHRTPTPSEAGKMVDAIADDDWELAALLLARTGARVGEVVNLRSCDVDTYDRARGL